jgi:hypothetical protein
MTNTNKCHEIFVSHRIEDREIAMAIKGGLQATGRNRICVHVCTQNQGTDNWKKEIEESIKSSDTMVFLYTVKQEEEDWRWCMYEIGLFIGMKLKDEISDKQHKLICIKNFGLKRLPSPIEGIEPYVADAGGAGIEKFCHDLLYTTKFTSNKLADEFSVDVQDVFAGAVEKINKAFESSRFETEYYGRRITINFTDNFNRVLKNIENAAVSGTSDTLPSLFGKEDNILWKDLYEETKKTNQTKWLDQLKENIHKIQFKEAFEKDLTPIRVNKGGVENSYIPIISSVTKNRIIDENQGNDTRPEKWFEVTELNVIFIKQTIDRENILQNIPTLIPFAKIKLFLDRVPETGRKCLQKDENGEVLEPVAIEMNSMCRDLYALSENEYKSKKEGWTTSALLNRLKEYKLVNEEDMKKLIEDQYRVIDMIVFQGRPRAEAKVPLTFNENHTQCFRNECFLPCLITYQPEGNTAGKHEAILLIAYIKDFWPPGFKH